MDKVLLVDLANQIHRAIHAFGAPKEEANEIDYVPIYSFFRSLRPLIELHSPDKCFVVLEGHPKFRYDLFAEYKANRLIKTGSQAKTKEEVYGYTDEIVRLLMFLPMTVCRAADYECDDVIGSLAENMKDEEITVISNDSDYIQLLQREYAKIQIYNPIKKEFMSAPKQFYVCLKSLRGDKSDNIPRLVSDKKAEAFCDNPQLLKEWMIIEENRANLALNQKLVQFANVPMEEIEFKEGSKNFAALKEEFTKMEFESIINDKSWEKFTGTFECLKY
jgi:5'-3' exonuclease